MIRVPGKGVEIHRHVEVGIAGHISRWQCVCESGNVCMFTFLPGVAAQLQGRQWNRPKLTASGRPMTAGGRPVAGLLPVAGRWQPGALSGSDRYSTNDVYT